MEIKALSATSIKDFLLCQLKLVFRLDKQIPSVKNDHARLGIAVHEALDQFTKRMKIKKSFPDQGDYDFALTTFMNKATEEGLLDLSFYKEGRQMVVAFVDKFDPQEKVIEAEYRFKLETPDGVPIVGAIDKVVEIDQDTMAIIDYKTARNAMTPYELESDIQLSMYDLAASMIWPQYKNRVLCLSYVRIDKSVSTYRTEEDRQEFREFLKSIWLNINSLSADEIKGRINKLCGWCDYSSYCTDYANLVNSNKMTLKPASALSNEEFLEQWENISDIKSIVEGRQRELKMIAHERFMDGQTITAAGKELGSTQQSRTTYNMEDVVDLVPRKDLFSVLTVNKSKLDAYSREDGDLRNKLARVAQISYNAPVYRVKTVKNGEFVDEQPGENEDAA